MKTPPRTNQKKYIYHEKGNSVTDLHGMTKKQAKEQCIIFMEKFKGYYVEFIVGRGLHSLNGPVLKATVKDILERHHIAHGEVGNNPGRVWARLPKDS